MRISKKLDAEVVLEPETADERNKLGDAARGVWDTFAKEHGIVGKPEVGIDEDGAIKIKRTSHGVETK